MLFQLAVAEQQWHLGSTVKKEYAQHRKTTKDEGHVSAIIKILHIILNKFFILCYPENSFFPSPYAKYLLFCKLTCVSVRTCVSCFFPLLFITQSLLTELIYLIIETVLFFFFISNKCYLSHTIIFFFKYSLHSFFWHTGEAQLIRNIIGGQEFWGTFLDYFPPIVSIIQQKRCHCI